MCGKELDTNDKEKHSMNDIKLIDETGWLIERGGLCLGISCQKPAWVHFTSEDAIRFCRESDARNLLIGLNAFGAKFDNCEVREHLWSRRGGASQRER